MTRALVLQPPIFLDYDFIDYPPMVPYATAAIAAALRREGCEVEALDAGCMGGADFARVPTGWRWGVDLERYLEVLRELDPADVVIVSQTVFQYTEPNIPALNAVIDAVRDWPEPERRLVTLADQSPGGMHRLDLPTDYRLSQLSPVDCLLSYESDAAIGEALRLWRGGETLPREIHGYAPDLAAIDDPDFGSLDLPRYQEALVRADRNRDWLYHLNGWTVPFLTSRGCPFRCNFCFPESAWQLGAKVGGFRAFQLERLERQFETLAGAGVKHLVVLDSTLNGNPKRFGGVLDLFEQHGFTIDIPNGVRADLLSDDDIARLQPILGELSISAESGDPDVVARVVGKRLDLDNIRRVAATCERVGLPLSIHWMVGQPGETLDQVKRTLKLAWQLFDRHGATPLLQFATPFPGTKLYREAVDGGWISGDPAFIPKLPSLASRGLTMRPPGQDLETVERLRHAFVARVERHRPSGG